MSNIDRQNLINKVLVLGKAARIFGVPVIVTAVAAREFDGMIVPQLIALFPDPPSIQRSSMNAWDDQRFVAAVKQTGRKNFLIAALWSEACLTFPALQMLEEGYGVYAVKDASRGSDEAAHDTALRRIEQAGGVSVTALQVLIEFQRDWARGEHYEEVIAIVKECCCVDDPGADGSATMVHNAGVTPRQQRRQPLKSL
jgi:nicotinamidase-related amidase